MRSINLWRMVWCLPVAFVAGCGNDSKPPPPVTQTAPKPSVRREPAAWANFQKDLAPVFAKAYPLSKHGHPGGTRGFLYASPTAKDLLLKLMANPTKWPGEFRTGSLLVQKQDDGALYIMRKRPLGRVKQFKDWYFALDRGGRVVIETGGPDSRAKEACVDCHSTVGAKTDCVVPPRRAR